LQAALNSIRRERALELEHRDGSRQPLVPQSSRDHHNGGKGFFTDGDSFAYWLRADRSLWRVPEHRFTLGASAEGRSGERSR